MIALSSLKSENLHDRLGSVRQIINTSGNVVCRYTYKPFGETFSTEVEGTLENPFMFTGQWCDVELNQYSLRARQYEPHIGRFTSRDPIFGRFEEPLTLHKYLYCGNEPINRIDPWGLWDKETHDWFIDLLFPLMSEKDKDFVKQGSNLVDTDFQALSTLICMR